MISLFSSIKEFLPDSREYPFKGGACKARKSVIIAPYTCLPDSNKTKKANGQQPQKNLFAKKMQRFCKGCKVYLIFYQ